MFDVSDYWFEPAKNFCEKSILQKNEILKSNLNPYHWHNFLILIWSKDRFHVAKTLKEKKLKLDLNEPIQQFSLF